MKTFAYVCAVIVSLLYAASGWGQEPTVIHKRVELGGPDTSSGAVLTVPYPDNCIVAWSSPSCNGGVFVCPSGDGTSLDVTLRDQFNLPVPGVPVTVNLSSECTIYLAGGPLNGVTDMNGYVRLPLYAGVYGAGRSSTCLVTTTVSTYGITIYNRQNEWKSPDFDADGDIDALDFSWFAQQWLTGGPTCDFDCSGLVDGLDFVAFALHWMNSYSPPPPPVSGGVRPKATDFQSGKEGRIMISALQDHSYYTNVLTTKDNTPAQTADRKVKITAHLTPAANGAGRTVYFRVVDPDPDDLSSYEPDGNKGDNYGGLGTLSATSSVAEVKTINGVQVAAAEVELTITDRYSGDNYQVECSLDPSFATILDRTAVMVAWKRLYAEYDKMYTAGSHLSDSFARDANIDPDSVKVVNPGAFAVGNSVIVFDADNPGGEPATITAIRGDYLILNADLDSSYTFGYGGTGKGAAVAIPGSGTYETNFGLIQNAYGAATDGTDGGCFVEIKDLNSGNNVPYLDQLSEADCDLFTAVWFANRAQVGQNYIYVVAARYANAVGVLGWASSALNDIYIFSQRIIDLPGGAHPTALSEVTAHEFGHQFGLNKGNNGAGHVDSTVAYDNHTHVGNCIMSYAENIKDGIAEFCYNGVAPPGDGDCIDDIRRLADGL